MATPCFALTRGLRFLSSVGWKSAGDLASDRLVICEFSHVPGPFGVLYRFYLKYFLPKISALFSKSPEAYDYLADSIQAWPKQKDLAQDIANVGFSQVGYKNLSFGIVALHQAVKR
jgi:demethylmenaquinone methyltransferase/2-methoxy-6-polyprenyl-1,4-benzoquinol methylase